ncbi:exodeoxyribonuclease VII large subunit [Acidaminococcus timonensis]|uniref:exodeoxyribonuclease VII large subunit n=1 Tax=Acidaminococcus timonensis TaxID=1871002 RepID=UPI002666C226|nr:exodeoxyribonuclease VII large subunit [uncultured Acidaminococcus sp.]
MTTIVGKIYTVSEVNRVLKGLIRQEPELANLQIQGEVSNFRQYPSGHCYFALKDGKTLLKCVMFAGSARRLKQLPQNGDQVLGVGRIDLYERDGAIQFYVDMLMPLGAGSLMVAYEQLKQKLSAEGLFDESRKKPLPAYPKTVGIVTSPAGAAVRDIINVSGRRDPSVKLLLYPVKVQGTEAPPEIVHGIQFFNRHKLADVLIVGRGGGSMEDLWAFNDERVVRAIAASEIPVISAVGHEIDFTLSDFAADLRAPTPSAAAELAVPERSGDRELLAKLVRRLERAMDVKLSSSETALERLTEEWGLTHPERLWESASQALDTLDRRLELAARDKLTKKEQKLQLLATKLTALDPYAVLRRGYTITENDRGQVVRNAAQLQPGDTLVTRFTEGTAVSTVAAVKEG